MNFLTRKAIPRRALLRGALALPLLDAMVPAATAWAQTPPAPSAASASSSSPWAAIRTAGPRPAPRPPRPALPILAPLEPVKSHLSVITNLRLPNAYPGTHDTSNSAFLSASQAKHTESSDYFSGHHRRPDRRPRNGSRYPNRLSPARHGPPPLAGL
jgi:hypothetical protein